MSVRDSLSSESSKKFHRRQNSYHDLSKHSQLNQSSLIKPVDDLSLNNSESNFPSSNRNSYQTDNEFNLTSDLNNNKNQLVQNFIVPDIYDNIVKSTDVILNLDKLESSADQQETPEKGLFFKSHGNLLSSYQLLDYKNNSAVFINQDSKTICIDSLDDVADEKRKIGIQNSLQIKDMELKVNTLYSNVNNDQSEVKQKFVFSHEQELEILNYEEFDENESKFSNRLFKKTNEELGLDDNLSVNVLDENEIFIENQQSEIQIEDNTCFDSQFLDPNDSKILANSLIENTRIDELYNNEISGQIFQEERLDYIRNKYAESQQLIEEEPYDENSIMPSNCSLIVCSKASNAKNRSTDKKRINNNKSAKSIELNENINFLRQKHKKFQEQYSFHNLKSLKHFDFIPQGSQLLNAIEANQNTLHKQNYERLCLNTNFHKRNQSECYKNEESECFVLCPSVKNENLNRNSTAPGTPAGAQKLVDQYFIRTSAQNKDFYSKHANPQIMNQSNFSNSHRIIQNNNITFTNLNIKDQVSDSKFFSEISINNDESNIKIQHTEKKEESQEKVNVKSLDYNIPNQNFMLNKNFVILPRNVVCQSSQPNETYQTTMVSDSYNQISDSPYVNSFIVKNKENEHSMVGQLVSVNQSNQTSKSINLVLDEAPIVTENQQYYQEKKNTLIKDHEFKENLKKIEIEFEKDLLRKSSEIFLRNISINSSSEKDIEGDKNNLLKSEKKSENENLIIQNEDCQVSIVNCKFFKINDIKPEKTNLTKIENLTNVVETDKNFCEKVNAETKNLNFINIYSSKDPVNFLNMANTTWNLSNCDKTITTDEQNENFYNKEENLKASVISSKRASKNTNNFVKKEKNNKILVNETFSQNNSTKNIDSLNLSDKKGRSRLQKVVNYKQKAKNFKSESPKNNNERSNIKLLKSSLVLNNTKIITNKTNDKENSRSNSKEKKVQKKSIVNNLFKRCIPITNISNKRSPKNTSKFQSKIDLYNETKQKLNSQSKPKVNKETIKLNSNRNLYEKVFLKDRKCSKIHSENVFNEYKSFDANKMVKTTRKDMQSVKKINKKKKHRSNAFLDNSIENQLKDCKRNTHSASKPKYNDVDYNRQTMHRTNSKHMLTMNTLMDTNESINPLFYNSYTNAGLNQQLRLEKFNESSQSKSNSVDKDNFIQNKETKYSAKQKNKLLQSNSKEKSSKIKTQIFLNFFDSPKTNRKDLTSNINNKPLTKKHSRDDGYITANHCNSINKNLYMKLLLNKKNDKSSYLVSSSPKEKNEHIKFDNNFMGKKKSSNRCNTDQIYQTNETSWDSDGSDYSDKNYEKRLKYRKSKVRCSIEKGNTHEEQYFLANGNNNTSIKKKDSSPEKYGSLSKIQNPLKSNNVFTTPVFFTNRKDSDSKKFIKFSSKRENIDSNGLEFLNSSQRNSPNCIIVKKKRDNKEKSPQNDTKNQPAHKKANKKIQHEILQTNSFLKQNSQTSPIKQNMSSCKQKVFKNNNKNNQNDLNRSNNFVQFEKCKNSVISEKGFLSKKYSSVTNTNMTKNNNKYVSLLEPSFKLNTSLTSRTNRCITSKDSQNRTNRTIYFDNNYNNMKVFNATFNSNEKSNLEYKFDDNTNSTLQQSPKYSSSINNYYQNYFTLSSNPKVSMKNSFVNNETDEGYHCNTKDIIDQNVSKKKKKTNKNDCNYYFNVPTKNNVFGENENKVSITPQNIKNYSQNTNTNNNISKNNKPGWKQQQRLMKKAKENRTKLLEKISNANVISPTCNLLNTSDQKNTSNIIPTFQFNVSNNSNNNTRIEVSSNPNLTSNFVNTIESNTTVSNIMTPQNDVKLSKNKNIKSVKNNSSKQQKSIFERTSTIEPSTANQSYYKPNTSDKTKVKIKTDVNLIKSSRQNLNVKLAELEEKTIRLFNSKPSIKNANKTQGDDENLYDKNQKEYMLLRDENEILKIAVEKLVDSKNSLNIQSEYLIKLEKKIDLQQKKEQQSQFKNESIPRDELVTIAQSLKMLKKEK